ncbi:MAG: hypothetical protein U0Q16_06555 [Bryobacteraceae bacterium]
MLARLPLLFGAAVALLAAPARSDKSSLGEVIVHEWGTFTTVAGVDGAARVWQPLGGPEDLPCFVRRLDFGFSPKAMFGSVRMETPVLYFYSPRAATLSVKVGFPKGLISEWYPDAKVAPRSTSGGFTLGNGSIEWGTVRVSPGADPDLPVERRANHYYAARETDAAPLEVNKQWERLLFYRGIGSFQIPYEVTLSGEDLVTSRLNPYLDPSLSHVPRAILFENRNGKIGFQEVNANGATVRLPSLDGSLPDLKAQLEAILVKEGLLAREAHAMVETWKDSWFEKGARLFYIVPRAFVDDVLPLQIEPAPAAVQRVFVGRIELMPAWVGREAVRALEADDLAAVKSWGRFWTPIAERYLPSARYGPEVLRYFRTASPLGSRGCSAEAESGRRD